ncbi:Flp pilus assembly protein CpaB [Planctomycetota bacterium]
MGLVAAGAAAVLVGSMAASRKAQVTVVAPPTVEIVIAAEDLESNRLVTDGSVTTKRVPRDKAPEGCFSDTTQVIGKVSTALLLKGQPITSDTVSDPGPRQRLQHLLGPGERLVILRVPTDEIGLLVPNARVDVMAFVTEPEHRRVIHGCLLEMVPVWALGNWTILDTHVGEAATKGKSPVIRRSAGPVFLKLTEYEHQLLEMAHYLRAKMSIALRNPIEGEATSRSPEFLKQFKDFWVKAQNKQKEERKESGAPEQQEPPPPPVVAEKPLGQELTGTVTDTRSAEGERRVTLTTADGTEYIVDLQDGKGGELATEMAGAKVVVTGTVNQKEKPAPEWSVIVLKAQTETTVKGKVAGAPQESDLILNVLEYRKWKAGDGENVAGRTGPGRAEPKENQRIGRPGASGNGGKPGTHHDGLK